MTFSFPEIWKPPPPIHTHSGLQCCTQAGLLFLLRFRLFYCYLLQFPKFCPLGEQTQAVTTAARWSRFVLESTALFQSTGDRLGLDPSALAGQVLCRCTPLPQLYIWRLSRASLNPQHLLAVSFTLQILCISASGNI